MESMGINQMGLNEIYASCQLSVQNLCKKNALRASLSLQETCKQMLSSIVGVIKIDWDIKFEYTS